MSENKETAVAPKKWKIEGEAFERIKAARYKYIEHAKALIDLRNKAKDGLWDAIKQEFPDIPVDQNYNLNGEHEDLGFFIVESGHYNRAL